MMLLKPPTHVTTTEHALALHPWQVEGGLPGFGMPIGRNIYGGKFRWDPFVLYDHGVVGDLNAALLGKMRGGKSSLLLTIAWRGRFFGRWTRYLDPKGDARGLVQAWNEAEEQIGRDRWASHIRLQPNGTTYINPLDRRISREDRQTLIASVVGAVLGRPLEPVESAALLVALESLERQDDPTLPALIDALNHPQVDDARKIQVQMTERELLEAGRNPAVKLAELTAGPLTGMFDRPTSPGISLNADLTVLDLSAVYRSRALPVLMLIADTFLQSDPEAATRGPGYYMVDEAWAVFRDLSVIAGLSADFKFCRSTGVSGIFALHGMSTLEAVGSRDSQQRALAEVLIGDCSTRWVYQTGDDQIAAIRRVTGITETASAELPFLTPGKGVVQITGWPVPFLVQHIITASEWRFIDPTEWGKRAG